SYPSVKKCLLEKFSTGIFYGSVFALNLLNYLHTRSALIINTNKLFTYNITHMKKILLAFVLVSASLAFFSSCTKEYYDMVPSKTLLYEKTSSRYPCEGSDKDRQSTRLNSS